MNDYISICKIILRTSFVILPALVLPLEVLAQASVDQATLEISGAYKVFKTLAYGVSGIMALIGGIKVYSKMSNGESEFQRSLIVWVSACAIVIAVPSVLDALYGTSGTLHSSLETANTNFRKNYDPTVRIMSALMALLGIVAAINVYRKWSMGDPDTARVGLAWFGALIFFGVVLKLLNSGLFGTF